MSLSEDRHAFLTAHREEAQARLLAWFNRQARDLPWRRDRTPYRIWVSEVMLQQTQVETVLDYYARFLERFPTIHDLAAASQEEVLKLWEGLGYYRRARLMHKAAQVVVADYGGELPADADALRDLPGIGRYTAGALASIAFDIPAPAVDGNVRRVMARVLAMPTPTASELDDAVSAWIPEDQPGDFAEGLMELGATLCRPQSPRCLLCPWRELCQARRLGRQEELPAPKARKSIPHYEVTAAVTLGEDDRILVARRPSDARLGGLWEFPGGKQEDNETLREALRRELQEEMQIEVAVGEELTVIEHAYTHFRITLHAFLCHLEAGEPMCIECDDFQWATLDEIRALPMPVTDRQIAETVEAFLSK